MSEVPLYFKVLGGGGLVMSEAPLYPFSRLSHACSTVERTRHI